MYKPIKSHQQPYIEATFENPVKDSVPIHVPAVQLKDDHEGFEHPRYYFLSPALGALDCKLYNIKITAYTDKTKQKIITEHENQLLSRINSESCIKSEFMERMNEAAKQAEWELKQ